MLAVLTIVLINFYILDNREIVNLIPLLALFGMCALRLIPSFNIIIQFCDNQKTKVSFSSIIKENRTEQNNFFKSKMKKIQKIKN